MDTSSNQYDGLSKHPLNCKSCGKLMIFKGTNITFDSKVEQYKCECGITAYVSDPDGDRDVIWSE